jgi:hypothetical protein
MVHGTWYMVHGTWTWSWYRAHCAKCLIVIVQGTRYKVQSTAQGKNYDVKGTWYMVQSTAQGIAYKVHGTRYSSVQGTWYSSVQGTKYSTGCKENNSRTVRGTRYNGFLEQGLVYLHDRI